MAPLVVKKSTDYLNHYILNSSSLPTRKEGLYFIISVLSKLSCVWMFLRKNWTCCTVEKIYSTCPTCNLIQNILHLLLLCWFAAHWCFSVFTKVNILDSRRAERRQYETFLLNSQRSTVMTLSWINWWKMWVSSWNTWKILLYFNNVFLSCQQTIVLYYLWSWCQAISLFQQTLNPARLLWGQLSLSQLGANMKSETT